MTAYEEIVQPNSSLHIIIIVCFFIALQNSYFVTCVQVCNE